MSTAVRSSISHTVVALSLIYVGLPLFLRLFHGPPADVASTSTTVPTATSTSVVLAPSQSIVTTPDDPKNNLTQFVDLALPKLWHGITLISIFLWRMIRGLPSLSLTVISPIRFLLKPILILLHPFLLILDLLYQTFILLPLRALSTIASWLYPIYLFCSIACVTGAVVGFGGRAAVNNILRWMWGDSSASSRHPSHGTSRRRYK